MTFENLLKAHEMRNPKFPVPTLDKMPKALRDYIKETKKKRLEGKDQPRQKKSPATSRWGCKKTVKNIPGSEWGGSVNKYVLREFWKS